MRKIITVMFLSVIWFFQPHVLFAATGDLQVTCEPDVRIFIDNVFKGITNADDNGLFIEGLAPGGHTLKAVKTNYTPIIKDIYITTNKAVEVVIRFDELQEKSKKISPEVSDSLAQVGRLALRSVPRGAVVFIDGSNKGTTDIEIDNVKVGRHNISFERGGQKLSGIFILSEGGVLKLKAHFKEKKIINISEQERNEAEKERIAEAERREHLTDMVYVKGGCYQMGDTFGDGSGDEKPVHEVCVDDFYIGKYEVTQGQWRDVMGNNPSEFSGCGDDCPVENVSWNGIREFIRKLGGNYRLPTEAEWEYAARSGGKKEKYASGDNVDSVAWYGSNSGNNTHQVGRKAANGLGIYDMSGNVWEWVQDWYGESYYQNSPRNNPQGPSSGQLRVRRGGSWFTNALSARGLRLYLNPGLGGSDLGFRLARTR
ncbi:MAG: SUMF1/EgtB/PvdO family nonheme iron enzyme [Nitrospirae bacterium]|nr:SUMF1/EgtB/PvdO family nonheme iron enzyme [Nitrospirota bacterium]